jgi:hypothetical protein
MPDPLLLPMRPRWVRVLLVFWLVETVLGIGFFVGGILSVGADPILPWVLIPAGLGLAVVGIALAVNAGRTLAVKGNLIEMTAAGFLDRRLSRAAIPWSALDWKLIRRGRSGATSLHFDVSDSAGGLMLGGLDIAVNVALNRYFGFPAYVVMNLGTGRTIAELASALTLFKAPSA